ncbi:MAG: TldD/PmbA family protein [Kaiparowitsia implicata GSE-PSE-MK54-09C]|jgi:predicted Zn-dependent protease|nr:TldD/PmbA family protein [Kaiparowitsia implicata GSE-PSE-MK54-09C]
MQQDWESGFEQVAGAIAHSLQNDEQFTLSLVGEHSQFMRVNHARVRQIGSVEDCSVTLQLMGNQRTVSQGFSLTGDAALDQQAAQAAVEELRQELGQVPADPYQVVPSGSAISREVYPGELLPAEAVAATVLEPVQGLDFTGLYAGGQVVRGYADSAGQRHWFATDTFALDYSIFTADGQAVKGALAGNTWDGDTYAAKLAESTLQLDRLAQPPKSIPRGSYRTYLAPAAIADIIAMFSWGGVSEAALQQGDSALALLQRGEKQLSPKFTLEENFSRGAVPRFNDLGEIAPIQLPLIQQGKLVNTLVSSRTAKEYGKESNGASSGEGPRSPVVHPGHLDPAQALHALDTGLYLSNLHYLNWSDRPTGRITGMTRYACFWVEHGEIVAPIENLRFDESLYHCLGDRLVDLTTTVEFIPEVGTYGHRSVGGSWVPGCLVDDFTYTL